MWGSLCGASALFFPWLDGVSLTAASAAVGHGKGGA